MTIIYDIRGYGGHHIEERNTKHISKTQNDLGSMYLVGYGQKGDGKSGIYNLTQSSERIKTVI